ncbi:MAG: hypothetical protein ACK4Z4_14280, partial [Ferrovibrio sp.]
MNRVSLTLAATLISVAAAIPLANAKTPPNLLVVAKNIDDIVSLDPAQAYEFTSGEVVANIYNKLVEYNPAQIEKIEPGL